jgi:hypothetical protein
MYAIVLAIHNLFRWIVLLVAAYTLFRIYTGWLGRRAWTRVEREATTLYGMALDIQLVLGLVLVFVSPLLRAAFNNLAAALAAETSRFFVLEHIPLMIAAVVLAHVGAAQVRKASDDGGMFGRAALWYSASLLVILVAIPWWRPLLRWPG